MKPLEVCQRAENLKKKSSKIPKNNCAATMVSAARRQIIGGGAPINKSRRRRRPQIVGGGAARPAHGSRYTYTSDGPTPERKGSDEICLSVLFCLVMCLPFGMSVNVMSSGDTAVVVFHLCLKCAEVVCFCVRGYVYVLACVCLHNCGFLFVCLRVCLSV